MIFKLKFTMRKTKSTRSLLSYLKPKSAKKSVPLRKRLTAFTMTKITSLSFGDLKISSRIKKKKKKVL